MLFGRLQSIIAENPEYYSRKVRHQEGKAIGHIASIVRK